MLLSNDNNGNATHTKLLVNKEKVLKHVEKRIPSLKRNCFVTKIEFKQKKLLRFVIGPNNDIIFDDSGKLSGHSFWLTPSKKIINKAIKQKLFEKEVNHHIQIRTDLFNHVKQTIKKRCLDYISLANKAGLVNIGLQKLKIKKISKNIRLLVLSTPYSKSTKSALNKIYENIEIIELFDSKELGQSLGKDSITTLGITKSKLSDKLINEIQKYQYLEDDINRIE